MGAAVRDFFDFLHDVDILAIQRVRRTQFLGELQRAVMNIDRVTGVNYLQIWVGSGSGITPLLDENG